MPETLADAQRLVCARFGCDPSLVGPQDMLGASASMSGTDLPVYGMRYLPASGTCGWYVWAGDYSDDVHFYRPLHAGHVLEARPEIAGYLGLPPGWCFVIAPGYEDVWQDDKYLIE
jgi:hypothetical protein